MPSPPSNETEAEWAAAPGHHILGRDDLPDLLLKIQDPPERLFVIGDPDILHMPALAIVGSRNPTTGGEQNAFAFARHLAAAGFCIVSGLARGIDAAAHRGALDAGARTVAFLGHGVDQVYPPAHRELAGQIAANGVLCSEFPLGSPPRREHFPQRNRLISGLSLGTLVVEAARRSGSLISARLSAEQGREIFAIPGSIHNPLSKGCHQLIRQGAKLVESADDIVAELGPLIRHMIEDIDRQAGGEAEAEALDPDYENLLEALGFDPASSDQLAQRTGLTIDQVSSMLLLLELEGIVESQAGGKFARLPK